MKGENKRRCSSFSSPRPHPCSWHCSLLEVETADRPGLLLEILKVVRDISIYVESAEIDTEVMNRASSKF